MHRFAFLPAGVFCFTALVSGAESKPTYYKDVLPVLQARCQGCHRPGEAAPFAMMSYKEVRPWAKAIKAAVVSRKMPPWFADPAVGHFKNDARLTPAEMDTITQWVDTGAAEGKAADAPPAREYVENWNIGKPDAVFSMTEPFDVPAQGTVDYQWIVIPTGYKEDKWIKAVEVRPGNRSVVHHVIAFYRNSGSKWLADVPPGVPVPKSSGSPEGGMANGSIGGFVPGTLPRLLPPGRALLLPAGADLVLQMHYTASGKAAKDQSKIGVVFAKEPVRERAFGIAVLNSTFEIPPGADNYLVDGEITLASDLRVVDMTPHMHLRGKSYEFSATFPDGKEEKLLNVPNYDFGWQLSYQFDEERVLPKGTRIRGVARFDNSPNNKFNPDPKATVRFGDQTWDEMMVGFVGIVVPVDFDLRKLLERPKKPASATGAE